MKKMISLLLALVMALSLVACAEQQNDNPLDNDTPINSDTQSEAQDSDHPVPPSDNENGDNAEDAGKDDVTTPSTEESNGDTEDKQPEETPEEEHKHDYSAKVTSATCTKDGYTTYTCSCGDSYKDNTTSKLGHSYSDKVVAPTTAAQGYTLHTCSRCGDSYKDSYTAKLDSNPSTGSSSTGSGTGGNFGNGSSNENTTPTPSTPSKPTVPDTPTQPTNPSTPSQPTTPSKPSTPSQPTTPSKPVHQHDYSTSVTPATCTTEGYTTYTCSCGDSYTDDYTSLKRHDWEEVWEEVPVYETVCITRCGHCHANLDDVGGVAHLKEEALAGNGDRSYESYEQVQIGTENQLVGYACSVCGTPK